MVVFDAGRMSDLRLGLPDSKMRVSDCIKTAYVNQRLPNRNQEAYANLLKTNDLKKWIPEKSGRRGVLTLPFTQRKGVSWSSQ